MAFEKGIGWWNLSCQTHELQDVQCVSNPLSLLLGRHWSKMPPKRKSLTVSTIMLSVI